MQKKNYECPELTKLGSAAEMTQWRKSRKHWWFNPPKPNYGDRMS